MRARRLILLRHAKSSWADAGQADHERPLNARGRDAAPRMGAWLCQAGYRPDQILCSSAVRTRETLQRTSPAFDGVPHVVLDELYLAAPVKLLKCIATHANTEARTVLVIAHNPGLEMLASWLAGDTVSMPTAAAAVFQAIDPEMEWASLDDSRDLPLFRLVAHQEPRELFGEEG